MDTVPRGAAPSGLSRAQLVAVVGEALAVVPYGAGVLLAVSGGPDSTALAHLVTEARPDLVSSVGHVRHGLRADREDARVAASHATALGLRYHEREVRVRPEGGGIEAAAREARYTALGKIARAERLAWVLMGHTADDQAETVLLNIARGTGIRGLAGMSPVRTLGGDLRVVRPLLRLRRADVRAFVEGEGIDAVSDPTNRDPHQRRRRARDELLPALARLSGGPGDPVAVLTRLADLAADDADALDEIASTQASVLVARWGPARALPAGPLEGLPMAVRSRVVRLMLSSVRGGADGLTADAVASVLGLQSGRAVDIAGGCWVTAGGGWVAASPSGLPAIEDREVPVPSIVPLESLGMAVHADRPWGGGSEHVGQTLLDLDAVGAPRLAEAQHLVPADALTPPRGGGTARAWTVVPAGADEGLRIRSRRPGDRIRLRRGQRKLQDVLVDARVPRAVRDLLPVLVDASDEPLWVPGVAERSWEADATAGARVWLAPSPRARVGYAHDPLPVRE
jgi:tRNA(Ile)-lysidine synthase